MTQIWAHRGARHDAPENTLAAFALAIEQKADGVEFDVQLTEDGVPIIIHDETVDRTTDGRGWVRDLSMAKIGKLQASAGMKGFKKAKIPTLTEALDLLAPTKLRVNIELKNDAVEYPELEEKVLEALAGYKWGDRVVLSSFSEESVAKLSGMTKFELAYIISDSSLLLKPWKRTTQLGASALHPSRRRVHERLVKKASDAGIKVRPWVVNNPKRVKEMLELGVDAIFTDRPAVAREVRRRHSY